MKWYVILCMWNYEIHTSFFKLMTKHKLLEMCNAYRYFTKTKIHHIRHSHTGASGTFEQRMGFDNEATHMGSKDLDLGNCLP